MQSYSGREHRVDACLRQCFNRAPKIVTCPNLNGNQRDAHRCRRDLSRPTQQRTLYLIDTENQANGLEIRIQLTQELQQFPRQAFQGVHDSSHVASRPGKAGDQAHANRIDETYHDDRDDCRRLLTSESAVSRARRDHIRLEANQLFCKRW